MGRTTKRPRDQEAKSGGQRGERAEDGEAGSGSVKRLSTTMISCGSQFEVQVFDSGRHAAFLIARGNDDREKAERRVAGHSEWEVRLTKDNEGSEVGRLPPLVGGLVGQCDFGMCCAWAQKVL